MKVSEILRKIENSCKEILGNNLIGIYVHGSLAFGCFRWETSDIDFLVVVKDSPSLAEKTAIAKVLLELDPDCPPKGLEMSVVLEEVCRNFVYPTPYELHFSNAHKEKCRRDPEGYCEEMHGTDKDLAAHFTVTRSVGIALTGKPSREVFGEIPREDYIDSIKDDIALCEEVASENGVLSGMDENPVYFILNLCRVLAYLWDGKVMSKEQGGRWGIENLPEEYHEPVYAALENYCGRGEFACDSKTCHAFARYMLWYIRK